MPWSWSNIDWQTTGASVAAAAVAFVFTAVQGEPEHGGAIGRLKNPKLWGNWTLATLAAVGAVLVCAAAGSDKDGLYGNVTAAWVQAVGSIAAIGAAIWIDQGAARRLRNHQVAQDDAAAESRVVAILNASNELREAAERIRAELPSGAPQLDLPTENQRKLKANARVLAYHLSQNVELNPGTLEGLALAEEIYSVAYTWALSHRPFPPNGAPEFVAVLESAAADLADIAAEIARETARV